MQTFLPYASFDESAKCLDWRRLGKQRVECKQILLAMEKPGAWSRHPATLMWAGYAEALAIYGFRICTEWRSRGYEDSLLHFFGLRAPDEAEMPPWLGDERFHASHRSNLLRKDPMWYGKYGWIEPADLPYVWPGSAR